MLEFQLSYTEFRVQFTEAVSHFLSSDKLIICNIFVASKLRTKNNRPLCLPSVVCPDVRLNIERAKC